MSFATTAFTVDGVNGLLAKDAALVVRYSKADLDAAGGDAKKLALARWDRSDNAWTIIPVTADTAAMTLTAKTNRFSTWAVVVTSGAATATTTQTADVGIFCGVLALAAGVIVARNPGRK
jgi:hypothetical protein